MTYVDVWLLPNSNTVFVCVWLSRWEFISWIAECELMNYLKKMLIAPQLINFWIEPIWDYIYSQLTFKYTKLTITQSFLMLLA